MIDPNWFWVGFAFLGGIVTGAVSVFYMMFRSWNRTRIL